MLYLELFAVFFKIGLFGFGGGYAILSLIQQEVVFKRGWISASMFTDLVAVSQMTPGPVGINSATYIGYSVTGNPLGSALATFALVLPSFVLMLAVTVFVSKYMKGRAVSSIMLGIRVIVPGLIGAAFLMLLNSHNFRDLKSVPLFAAAFLLSYRFKVHPAIIIILSGTAGFFLYGFPIL